MIIKDIIGILLIVGIVACKQKTGIIDYSRNYVAEEVAFNNEVDNIQIRGTLTLPKSENPLPAVILVPGSGRTNRNGTENDILKPFLEIADFLSTNKMAVLRCDKRGVGDSEGTLDFNTTIDDLASDIIASIDYLSQRPEIDKTKIGLIGHSFGGIIAAKASLERAQISFVVLLGSPGVKNGEILFQQISDIPKSFGINDTTIEKFHIIIKNTSEILNSNASIPEKRSHVELMYKYQILEISESEKTSLKNIGYDYSLDASTYSKLVVLPSFYEFYTFDPQIVLKNVQCPILSLIGEKDLQVNPEVNQPVIERALREGGNKTYSIHTPKGYNHLFQKSIPGNPMDYEKQMTTITPEILNYIYTWITSDKISKMNIN